MPAAASRDVKKLQQRSLEAPEGQQEVPRNTTLTRCANESRA